MTVAGSRPKKAKPGKKGRTGPKFDERILPAVLDEVARSRRKGLTQHKIVDHLHEVFGVRVTQPMVVQYEKMVIQRYRESTVEERAAYVAEHCAAMDDVIAEAYAAWEVSKKEIEKWIKKTYGPQPCYKCKGEDCQRCEGTGMVTPSAEEVFQREGRVPGAEYMRLVIDARKQQAQLLGILGVGNVNIDARTQTVNMPGGVSWQQFFDATKAGPPAENPAEAKLKAVLDKPVEEPK